MKTPIKRKSLKSDFIVLLIAFTLGLTHQQCTRGNASEDENKQGTSIPVKIAQEKIQHLVQSLDVSGLIVTSKEHRLSFKTGGIIDKVFVKEGQSVLKGQLLATLKPDEIEAQVHQAQLGFDKAKRDYDRINNLYQDSVATLEQLQNVSTAIEIARSNLAIAEYNKRFSKIEAPTNGMVLKKLNESNELVGPGQPILVLASNEEEWQMKTGLTDKEVVRVSLNDSANVTIDAYPGQTLHAVVSQIGDAPDPMTGLYETRLSLPSSNLKLKPGFFANATITPRQKQSYVVIPIEAVTEGVGNTISYYTLSPDKKKAIKKTAEAEWIQNNFIVLKTKTQKTEAVVIESQKELSDHALVEIVESTGNL